jgi:hypothetical protein
MAKDVDDDAPINLDDMQVLTDAIAGTEKEIYRSAVGEAEEDQDETGDRSLEEMGDGLAGEHEPEEDEDEPAEGSTDDAPVDKSDAKDDKEQPRADDGKFKAEDGKEQDVDDKHPVPRAVLQAERAKRQEAEAARLADRTEFDRRMAALEAQLKAPREEAKTVVEAPKNDAPDMFLDPVGYQSWVKTEMERRETTMRADFSLRLAAQKHGDVYVKAENELKALDPRNPQHQQIGQSIARSPDPGEALVNWYRQTEAMKRIGNDPDAYDRKVRDDTRAALLKDPEVRKQILADMQAEARGGGNGTPRTVVRLPSLNGASGSSSARNADPGLYNNSEKSVFDFATGE